MTEKREKSKTLYEKPDDSLEQKEDQHSRSFVEFAKLLDDEEGEKIELRK